MKGPPPPRPKKPPSSHKLKLICSFGGEFTTRQPTGELRYVGGESRIICIDRRGVTLSRLRAKVSELRPRLSFSIKYQLPEASSSQLLLVSVATDDDVRRMIEDHDWLVMCGKVPRLRIFLCDDGYVGHTNPRKMKSCYPLGDVGTDGRDSCRFLGRERVAAQTKTTHVNGIQYTLDSCEENSTESSYLAPGIRKIGTLSDYTQNFLTRDSFSDQLGRRVHSRNLKRDDGLLGDNNGFLGVPKMRSKNQWADPHCAPKFQLGFDDFGVQRDCYGKFSKCYPGLRARSNISKLGQGRSHEAHWAKPVDPGGSRVLPVSEGRSLATHNYRQGILPAVAKEKHGAQCYPLHSKNPLLILQSPKPKLRDNTVRHGSNLTQLDDRIFCSVEPPSGISLHNLTSTKARSPMPCSSLGPDACASNASTSVPRYNQCLQVNKGDLLNDPFNLEPVIAAMAEELVNVNLESIPDISIKGSIDVKCLEAQVSLDMVKDVAHNGKKRETIPSTLNIEEKTNLVGSTSIWSEETGETSRSLFSCYSHLASQELQTINNSDLEEIRELGSGACGTVYYGKWKGSDVAIKRLKPSLFSGDELGEERLVADFWKEARLLGQLHHPNVLAFYGVVADGPVTNLATVTEYMVNGSLKQVLHRKDRTIDRRKRLIIAMDIAFGMEYLHEKNVVHFDLKSHNLLVNMRDPHRPVCKIGDLGLSKVKQRTLVSGGVRGTIPWMAPELLRSKSNMVSEKVDVYSFGIVMWELLTGEEPYENMRSEEIIAGIIAGQLRPNIPSWCDPAWRSLMENCWSSDPDSRPQFLEIAKELRAIASSVNVR